MNQDLETIDALASALALADAYLDGFVWVTEPEASELAAVQEASRLARVLAAEWRIRRGLSASVPTPTTDLVRTVRAYLDSQRALRTWDREREQSDEDILVHYREEAALLGLDEEDE